jgi:hypothetical protein
MASRGGSEEPLQEVLSKEPKFLWASEEVPGGEGS